MNEEKIMEVLKNEARAMKSAEIAEVSGVEKAIVDKAIKKLIADGKVESPKRCFYQAK
jgi:Mn-dependent DtxR family transcriptional regulator